MNQLIHCINCDEIFLKTPFDKWPEYESFPPHSPESFRTIERDDFQNFLNNHRGHRLQDLQVIDDSFVSEKAYIEPIRVSYFKATNGREKFVVKKYREKIDEPLRYQLIAGDYYLRCVGIEIQEKEVAKQLKGEFKAAPLSQKKLNAFFKLLRQILEIIEIKDLERIAEESSNPLEVYYKLDDVSLAYLLRNCRNIFKGKEYINMEEFIHRHKDDGVLLLKATYKIRITKIARSAEKATAGQIRSENRKTAVKG